jgi:hypothetical protein
MARTAMTDERFINEMRRAEKFGQFLDSLLNKQSVKGRERESNKPLPTDK